MIAAASASAAAAGGSKEEDCVKGGWSLHENTRTLYIS